MKPLLSLLICLLALPLLAGDLTTDNLTVNKQATLYGNITATRMQIEPVIPFSGLGLWYPFTADEGGIASDASGNGRVGTLYSATWTTPGFDGGCVNFDGVDDYVAMGTALIVDTSQPFSIAMWTYSRMASSRTRIVGLKGATEFGAMLGREGGYLGYFGFRDNSAMQTTDTRFEIANLRTNWHFIVWTYNGGNKSAPSSFRVYLDGNELAVVTANFFGPGPNENVLGAYLAPQPVACFNGLIDEVRIYNRALSLSEVIGMYWYYRPSEVQVPQVEFLEGVKYIKPLGDVDMGIYQNNP